MLARRAAAHRIHPLEAREAEAVQFGRRGRQEDEDEDLSDLDLEDIDTEMKQRIDSLIKELEDRITQAIASDDRLSETAVVLRSIPGIGPVVSAMLIAEMPEIGTITGEEAAALTGLAPVAHDSGTLRGKRAIAGGRRALRHVMFQAALVAAHHNPSLKSFADRLRKAGKPHKVVITAVARKLVIVANALCKSRQKWTAATA